MRSFGLLLFTTDVETVQAATAAGVDAIIVDWEYRGKDVRQSGADTEINRDTYEDLRRVRSATPGRVICRVNGFCDSTPAEVDTAMACGATEILLPMVRTVGEVEKVIDHVDGRCDVSILIETVAAVENARDLARLPLARVYVGLNDLAIERRSPHIFDAVVDGTIDGLRQLFSMPFGFGGLTLPNGGHPISCRLLIGEMARLDCHFSFLRRSFHRDVRGRSMVEGLNAIRLAINEARRRTDDEIAQDRHALKTAVLAAYV